MRPSLAGHRPTLRMHGAPTSYSEVSLGKDGITISPTTANAENTCHPRLHSISSAAAGASTARGVRSRGGSRHNADSRTGSPECGLPRPRCEALQLSVSRESNASVRAMNVRSI